MNINRQRKIINVLLVDDSIVATTLLKGMLSLSPSINVVGCALNGKEALKLIPFLKPDVICTDIVMPVMNGIELIHEVMCTNPMPILVISEYVSDEHQQNVFELLEAGAIDVFQKPDLSRACNLKTKASELISKIKIISGVVPFTKHKKKDILKDPIEKQPPTLKSNMKIIAIGASTGGPQVFHAILQTLPPNYAFPIVCIQHISNGFLHGFIEWLAGDTTLTVKIATDGEIPKLGTVYFAPENLHLEMNNAGHFITTARPAYDGHKPSITVTFNSLAKHYGSNVTGILLSGMGKDGAEGLFNILQAGGSTIAQDEDSSVVFGMPKQAINLGAAQCVLSVDEIIDFLAYSINHKCKKY
ncbi:MAG: chemotaxis-specific protein-glutamate methyltransferase CheB [Candidatus Magnetoovum sp. WYHC-5]|nr:chemotaxis-specific protein-glutamate methyltransferase CheB [Candidatus Magnetoovum sp. WYHC-5]